MTSTRANPERKTDFLSDYDIELYVADVEPFLKDDTWLAPFGPIQTLEMMEGGLPVRAQRLVKEWANLYQKELLEMWNRQEFRQLPGLE